MSGIAWLFQKVRQALILVSYHVVIKYRLLANIHGNFDFLFLSGAKVESFCYFCKFYMKDLLEWVQLYPY